MPTSGSSRRCWRASASPPAPPPSRPPCRKARSCTKATRRMSGSPARPTSTLAIREITRRGPARGMVQVLAGLQPGEKVVTAGSLFIDRAAERRRLRWTGLSFALQQRVLMVVLMLGVFGAGLVCLHAAQHRGLSRSGAAAGRDRHAEHRASRPRRSSATSPSRSRCRWRDVRIVTSMRTISVFGLSDVQVQFSYDVTYEQAEQWVINRLAQMAPLPNGRYAADLAGKPDRRDPALPRGRAAATIPPSTSRPSRTGCWSAASRRCPA